LGVSIKIDNPHIGKNEDQTPGVPPIPTLWVGGRRASSRWELKITIGLNPKGRLDVAL